MISSGFKLYRKTAYSLLNSSYTNLEVVSLSIEFCDVLFILIRSRVLHYLCLETYYRYWNFNILWHEKGLARLITQFIKIN